MGGNMTETSEHTASLQVLHLEDDPVDAELIQRNLQDHNIHCQITRVCTQKDFEAEIQKGGIDCILSDSHLPGFDTLSALVLMRETRPAVPFIFVSGNDSPQIKADALLLGASDFISKNDLPRFCINFSFQAEPRRVLPVCRKRESP